MAPAGTGAEKVLHHNTIKLDRIPTILFMCIKISAGALPDARRQITCVWLLRRRRPRGGSSGFARASCALWRARPCGLNQIRPPSKTQAFLGRPNFSHTPALSAIALNILVCYALWHKKRSPHPNQRRHIAFPIIFVRFSQFQSHFLCPAPAFLAGAYFKPSPYFIMFYRKLNFFATILNP